MTTHLMVNRSDDAGVPEAGTVVVARAYGGLEGTRKKARRRLQVNTLKWPKTDKSQQVMWRSSSELPSRQ